jgi:hypothetical protein
MNILKSFLLALVATVILFGCGPHDNPVATAPDPPSVLSKEAPAEIGLTYLPAPVSGVQKLIWKSQRIVASKGGTIDLSYAYYSVLGKCSRNASLKIPPGALAHDTDITMAFDTSVAGVRFQPEGLVFKGQALLDYSIKGVYLSTVASASQYSLYYDSENGYYERQTVKKIQADYGKGTLACTDGKIHHFSRYAFGR